jgi:ketosteroid isomerase-like protein
MCKAANEEKEMSEANKVVAVKFLQALGAGDVATMKTILADDVVAIATGTSVGSGSRNYAEIMAVVGMFPQISKTGLNPKILSVTAEEDRVAIEWEGNCTLVTGAQYNNQYTTVFFLRDGKIVKVKEYFDTKLTDAVLGPLMAAAAG